MAVAVAAVASFLAPFSGSATNVALPAIARDFALDAVSLSWVGMAYLLAAAAALLPLGRLADIHGRKRVFTWGVLTYAAASLACALAPTGTLLLAARVLQGLAGAAIFGTNVAILTSVLPPGRRGAALGLNVASVYLGLSLGPFLGGLLTEQAGWRSLFHLGAALGLGLAAVVRRGLQGEWRESRGQPFDASGALLYATGLVALMVGFARLPAPTAVGLAAAGLALLLAGVDGVEQVRTWLRDLGCTHRPEVRDRNVLDQWRILRTSISATCSSASRMSSAGRAVLATIVVR